ncbi:MAG TPA: DNA primase [Candidatus Eisenbacteria bacterium]|jgi:DNA primase|nr:DNA primase [Candidatus Eisenbacteria bacterium]
MSSETRAAIGADEMVERVRAASEITAVVGTQVTLKKAGRTWKGLCPFHQEKTPSFTVSAERQTYHCFGCGAGGDVFRFVQETEKVTFPEALRLLADRAGIRLPAKRGPSPSEPLYEILEEAAEFYRRTLLDPATGQAARAVLAGRGIEDDTRERFGMGYAPAGWDALSSRLGPKHGQAALVRAGLAVEREGGRGMYDRFRDRLVVPLRLPTGRVVGFGGRSVSGEEPKYLNSPETPVYRKSAFIFGLPEAREALRESGEAILVEGYFDVMALSQAGVREVVAASGTAITAEQGALLSRYAARVCLALDGDRAGSAAMQRGLVPLLGAGLAVRVLILPEGDDPDTLVRRVGKAGFDALRAEAQSVAGFLCRQAGESGEAHGRAVAQVIELARELPDLARREALLVDADRLLGVGVDRLRRATESAKDSVRPIVSKRAGAAVVQPAKAVMPERRQKLPFVERSLLALLVAEPSLADRAAETVPEDWIHHPAARQAWRAIVADPQGGAARWCESAEGEGRALLTALASETGAAAEAGRAWDDHVRRLEYEVRKLELNRLQSDLARLREDSREARDVVTAIEDVSHRMWTLKNPKAGQAQGKGESE